MASRGPYKRGVAKRAEILDAAVHVIERNGFSNATVKELADAVGLSQNGLLHYFGSKDRLFMEVLQHRDAQLMTLVGSEPHTLADDVRRRVLTATDELTQHPGLLQLFLQLSVDASEPQHPAHAYFDTRYRAMRSTVTAAFEELRADGRVPKSFDPTMAVTLITAAMEGLQMQWSYDSSLDMQAHLAYLMDALGIAQSSKRVEDAESTADTGQSDDR